MVRRTDSKRLAARRFNERVKLIATFFNALAFGTIGAGAIIPAARTLSDLGWATAAWFVSGLVLHGIGSFAYTLLRDED